MAKLVVHFISNKKEFDEVINKKLNSGFLCVMDYEAKSKAKAIISALHIVEKMYPNTKENLHVYIANELLLRNLICLLKKNNIKPENFEVYYKKVKSAGNIFISQQPKSVSTATQTVPMRTGNSDS